MTTLDAAFHRWTSKREHGHLPWETPNNELRAAFAAGWYAHAASLKQFDMFGDKPITTASERKLATAHPADTILPETIYAIWPVKKARGAAIKAIAKAMKMEQPAVLLGAVTELAECYKAWPAAEKQYLPMCSTFFNQERWADDRSTWRKGAAAAPSQFSKEYKA